jgi:putative tryptophan/tyrosine transport system substrate-binding protein
LADPRGYGGIANNRRTRHARREEPGGVAAGPRQIAMRAAMKSFTSCSGKADSTLDTAGSIHHFRKQWPILIEIWPFQLRFLWNTELVRGRIAVIIASGGVAAAVAAKAATTTIPILFVVSEDPVRLGLVASLARPSGNLTGVNFFNTELAAKQLELLRELLPRAARVAVFINPASATAETTLRDVEPAARAIGLQIQVLRASTSQEIDTAFATFARERPDALFISNDGFLNSRRVQLVQLAAHHRVPAIYSGHEYSEIGGLMSYGTNVADAYRQLGVYAGRILKGAKPADLPVVQPSKFELVINHQTARMLGLTVPDKLLVAADEVIE